MIALLNTAFWHAGICLRYIFVEYSRLMPSFHTEQLETRGACLHWCQDQATKLCAEAGHVNGFSTVLMQSYGCKLAQSGQTKLVPFRNTTCTCTHRWSAHIPHFITLFFLHHSYFPSCKGWTGLPLTPLRIAKLFCGKQEMTLSVRRRNIKPKSFSSPWYWLGSHWFLSFPHIHWDNNEVLCEVL